MTGRAVSLCLQVRLCGALRVVVKQSIGCAQSKACMPVLFSRPAPGLLSSAGVEEHGSRA